MVVSDEKIRLLITGVSGFIGSNLLTRALSSERFNRIVGVDDMSNGHREFLPKDWSLDDLYVCDFAGDEISSRVSRGDFDVVVHLAACPRVSYSVEYPIETYDTNFFKTIKLIEACKKGKVKRFVFASSSSVYGFGVIEYCSGKERGLVPTQEDSDTFPQSPYAMQKLQVEQYLRMCSELYDFESVCMRFSNVYGPNQIGGSPYSTALSNWLDAVHRGVPMRSDGDGEQSRDLVHVDDVADALIAVSATMKNFRGDAMNVSVCDSVTNNSILEKMKHRYRDATVVSAPARKGDVRRTCCDNREIERRLGWAPQIRFEDGMQMTCDWYDANWSWIKDLTVGV